MKIDKLYIDKTKEDILDGILPIPTGLTRATQGLFFEYRHSSKCTAMYNLGDVDKAGTVSMYQLYMQCPTEYDAALILLGSMKHWKRLCECTWFAPIVEQWRYDMAVRNSATGESAVFMAALGGNVVAGKALVSQNKVGRPPSSQGQRKPAPTQGVQERDVENFLEAGREAINNERRNRKH